VRGIFTACILSRLNEIHPGFLSSFDLIAGTSTGSILALCLAKGITPEEMVYAYNVACPNIFQPKWYHRYRVFGFSAKYDNIQLKEYLENWLGAETLLKDIQQRVVVTAFRVDGKESTHDSILNSQTEYRGRWRPAVFSNFPTLEGVARTDDKLLAVDACLRSSAAPTFFPSKTSLHFFFSRALFLPAAY
jgi:patatin-like phospholipase/acyl hydrolase